MCTERLAGKGTDMKKEQYWWLGLGTKKKQEGKANTRKNCETRRRHKVSKEGEVKERESEREGGRELVQ